MTIDRTYHCDLCRASVPPELLDKMLFGLHWTDDPHGWVVYPARDVEHHICATCLKSLKMVFTSVSAIMEK